MGDVALRLDDDEDWEIHESLGASQRCAIASAPLMHVFREQLCTRSRERLLCPSRSQYTQDPRARANFVARPCVVVVAWRRPLSDETAPPCDQHTVQGQ
jgi:hypothetical protein